MRILHKSIWNWKIRWVKKLLKDEEIKRKTCPMCGIPYSIVKDRKNGWKETECSSCGGNPKKRFIMIIGNTKDVEERIKIYRKNLEEKKKQELEKRTEKVDFT